MTQLTKPGFKIIGISVKTCNTTTAMQDIGNLWQRFFAENIMQKIPNVISQEVYCLYSDYEGDYLKPYVTTIGCMVEANAHAPEGLVAKVIPEQKYRVYLAQGQMPDAIIHTWQDIWSNPPARAYIADFEVYGAQSQDPEKPEVEVLIGLK
jgi:predicted transcriptional regulator YdeE